MTSSRPVTVVVTGAAGQIGYATVFRAAAGDLLGPGVPLRLHLLELPQARRAAEGTALELQDGAFPLLEGVDVFDDAAAAFEGASVGLLIGARPRSKGMERADLLEANAGIFSVQGRAANDGAADDFRAVVVGNPANTNAYIAASHAPDVPRERFTALTRLDHHRAVAQLAAATGARVADVDGVAIWGNHSATQYPDLTHATVGGRPAPEALAEKGLGADWVAETFIPRVAKRGAEIIEVRGGSSVASAAHAALCHVRDWVRGTPDGSWTSMAVPSDGSYGVPEGLVSSFPVTCRDGAATVVPGLELDGFSRARIERSVAELVEERTAVRELGLLGPRG
ncbi:malate dehydrogenase [Kocuria dechangensis]|uniref:Malate dehydrogenase n=1 Tax=Kocuria dechangensis TaxID=1176249 RepID=A0A917LTH7_9MICC|nr:malate dehydrogenase [Kocuria dechangensis]GGG55922.1 malate dehydrogenase [Kocuria dechangensis]